MECLRYALDVNTERAEDVLTHKRLLEEAKLSPNIPVFYVRVVRVSSCNQLVVTAGSFFKHVQAHGCVLDDCSCSQMVLPPQAGVAHPSGDTTDASGGEYSSQPTRLLQQRYRRRCLDHFSTAVARHSVFASTGMIILVLLLGPRHSDACHCAIYDEACSPFAFRVSVESAPLTLLFSNCHLSVLQRPACSPGVWLLASIGQSSGDRGQQGGGGPGGSIA